MNISVSNGEKRAPLHLDYFRDKKERICMVITWHHPIDKRLCIVKYDLGNSYWTSRETGIQYKRILRSYSLKGHQENLEKVVAAEPEYLYHSKVYGVDFLAVPIKEIKHYYYPEVRLQEIFNLAKNDSLDTMERKVKVLAELINDHLKVPFENMGISGSIIWKGHTKKSDINFVIYGNKYAQGFSDKFSEIYEVSSAITSMPLWKRKKYEKSMARKSGLSTKITAKYIARKKWLSVFGETDISIVFSPLENERPFSYGDQLFSSIVPIDLECTISDSAMGFTYPAIYTITECKLLKGKYNNATLDIRRIVSFEGALTGYFYTGERVVVRGLLQKVSDSISGETFHQIILGTKECTGNEFMILESDYKSLTKK